MFDLAFHQASSLYSTTPEAQLRFAAVVQAQGHDTVGLETLWQLCSHLQRLGYPVVVLDGSARESAAAPGLAQLLASSLPQAAWGHGADLGAPTDSLAVLPAGLGLRQLAAHAPGAALQHLQDPLRAYALVVLYAPADVLGPILAGQGSTPLVLIEPEAHAVVHGYQQVKLLAMHAVPCAVACVVRDAAAQMAQARDTLDALQRCAHEHLGQTPRASAIDVKKPQELQRLALQWLENAGTLATPLPLSGTPIAYDAPIAASTARNH